MPRPAPSIARQAITGLVLAGGQGSRMGGLDKGLQLLGGTPLAQHCAQRLALQVGSVLVNANRNLATYAALGWPLVVDEPLTAEAHAGPLAGFAAGLAACPTAWLLTVACDTPFFPTDLAVRLAAAASEQAALVAMACTPPEPGSERPRPQPTFCLVHASLAGACREFVAQGGRKVRQWAMGQRCALVQFDDAAAFSNANTAQELAQMQARLQAQHTPQPGT